MSDNKYDDSAKGGFSFEEKLRMVAEEQMAPSEIGLADANEARLQLMPEAAKKLVFGTTLIFRAGVVPPELRAEWALQETKVVLAPSDALRWKADWMEEHKHEYPIQGDLCCGNANARFGQAFKDPVLGLCQMLRIAADTLEKKYTEEPTEQPATVTSETTTGPQQDEPTTDALS